MNTLDFSRLAGARPGRGTFAARCMAWLMAALVAAVSTSPAQAQDGGDAVDPPSRVGRLAEVDGEVWVFDDEAGEWVEAARNRPVAAGDRLSSSRSGRAEVRVGTTTLRIDGSTELEVASLDDDRMVLRLHSGDVAVRLRTRDAAQGFELVTSEGSFQADRAGSYRFTREDDATEASTWSGQLQLRAQDAGVTVKAGQRYRFWRDNGTQFELAELRRDGFDDWVASRDDREERSVSARYVSPEMTGVEDLDRYGRWEQDAEYGALWIPRTVAPGWAPYRAGHWVWMNPWGWTWVDDAPWGFAPFHYGRWVSRGGTWCWSPGRYTARPVYAPALVAWIGGGAGSVSVTVGRRPPPTVGWFPLGPREVYVPGHRFTPHYMRHVNDNHLPNGFNYAPFIRDPRRAVEHGHYRHRGLHQAVTIVPRQVIERRQPVGPAIIGVSGRPVPGFERERPRPDAPVMPGGRPPGFQRPAPQAGIPAAPGGFGDRFGGARPGRGERPDGRGEPGRWRSDDRAPSPGIAQPGQAVTTRPQPGWGGGRDDDRGRPGPSVDSGRPPGDDRWRQLRPATPQTQPQPQPQQPQLNGQPQQPWRRPDDSRLPPDRDAHRPGGFNHMRPHGQPERGQPQPPAPQMQPVRPQQSAPQPMAPPPQVMQPRPMPVAPPQMQAPRPQAQPPAQQPGQVRQHGGVDVRREQPAFQRRD